MPWRMCFEHFSLSFKLTDIQTSKCIIMLIYKHRSNKPETRKQHLKSLTDIEGEPTLMVYLWRLLYRLLPWQMVSNSSKAVAAKCIQVKMVETVSSTSIVLSFCQFHVFIFIFSQTKRFCLFFSLRMKKNEWRGKNVFSPFYSEIYFVFLCKYFLAYVC